MKNNKGFTLIELLAVIVVLAIVTVIASSSILPYMSNARVDAFEVEATNIVKSAQSAMDLYNMGQVKLKGDTTSCKKDNNICFSVQELIDLGIYNDKTGNFKGYVNIDVTNSTNPTYELYLQKGAEFYINGGTETDYVDSDSVKSGDGNISEGCSCS